MPSRILEPGKNMDLHQPDPATLLQRYRILHTPPEPAYDSIVRVVARSLGVPVAGIAFASGNQLWVKAGYGFSRTELPLDQAGCQEAIAAGAPQVICDTLAVPACAANPLLSGPAGIRFYASVPLVTPEGVGIGVLFAACRHPRPAFADEDLQVLRDLAQIVMTGMELRLRRLTSEAELAEAALTSRLLAAAGNAFSVEQAFHEAMTIINDAVAGCACVVWQLADGSRRLRKVDGVASARLLASGFLTELGKAQLPLEDSVSAQAARTGAQITIRSLSTVPEGKNVVLDIGRRHGVISLIVTPLTVAGMVFSIAVCFDDAERDLVAIGQRLRKATQAFIPALARTIEAQRATLFYRIVEASSDSVMVTDAEMFDETGPRIVYANPSFQRMSGYTLNELVGRSPRVMHGPLTDPRVRQQIRNAMTARTPAQARQINHRADGRSFTVDISLAPVSNAAGETTHFVAIERDVTEAIDIEEAQRKTANVLAAALRLARIGTWQLHVATGALDWSRELYEMIGIEPDAGPMNRDRARSLIHPDDRAIAAAWLNDVIASRREAGVEYRFIRPDGTVVSCWLEVRHRLEPVTGEEIIEGFCQDVSERREIENALAHAEKLRTIGQMTSGVAHDFNNLLTVITVSLELAEAALPQGDPLLRLIRAARNAADKGAHLIGQLLAHARRQRLAPRTVTPAGIAEALIALMRRTLGETHTLYTKIDAAAEPVLADPGQLEAALVNLLINARDAQTQGGPLVLSITPAPLDPARPGRFTAFIVTDRGTGMDNQTVERAFEPFFTTKPLGKGTGLGLSMVLGFARQSGGHVAIDSKPGLGTSVRLLLPVSTEPVSVPPVETEPQERLPGLRVLVVEQEDDVREAACRLATECGLLPVPAASAAEALAMLNGRERFALLFASADIGDGMTGDGLAAAARALLPGLAVLLASGSGEQFRTTHAFVEKPYSRADLIAAVREALAGNQQAYSAAQDSATLGQTIA